MFPRFPPEGSGTTPPGTAGCPPAAPAELPHGSPPAAPAPPGALPAARSCGRKTSQEGHVEQKVSREGPGWEQRPIVTHLQAARLQLSPSRCQRARDKQPSAPAANSSTSAGGSAQTNRTTPVPTQHSCSRCNPATGHRTLLPPLRDPTHCRGLMGSIEALRSQTLQSQNHGII